MKYFWQLLATLTLFSLENIYHVGALKTLGPRKNVSSVFFIKTTLMQQHFLILFWLSLQILAFLPFSFQLKG